MGSPAYEIGVCCGRCEVYSPVGTTRCQNCGNNLALIANASGEAFLNQTQDQTSVAVVSALVPLSSGAQGEPIQAASTSALGGVSETENQRVAQLAESKSLQALPPTQQANSTDQSNLAQQASLTASRLSGLTLEELMDQVKNFVCTSCMTPVPTGHKFCGRCGGEVPPEILDLQVKFFSEMQNTEKARLILIRGEGQDGQSYFLKFEQHIVGRAGQLQFPDDPFISPKHANLFYRDNQLVVRDEGSLNGVYLRIRGGVEIQPGDTFLVGEQLFRLDAGPHAADAPDADGTFFYSSPKHPTTFRLVQLLEGGATGMTVCARESTLQIGRENGDLNFPGDVYMSARHCTVAEEAGRFTLTDHDSRNGTYVRIKSEASLSHGDYVFIGRKLLRVELNSN